MQTAREAAAKIIAGYEEMSRMLPLAGGIPRPIEECDDNAVIVAREYLAGARWHDDPPVPGLYYWETCDQYGNPRPGFYLWEDGKEKGPTPELSRFFGPIVGAMRQWETVPADDK